MSEPSKQGDNGIKKSSERWQSDIIVDLIKQYEFPYIALNPGASFEACTIRWSTTARTSRRCCSATMKKSPCKSPTAMPRRPANR